MAQNSRDKEFWLIPKRANLHQSVILLKGIIDNKFDKKTWNTSKQDRLGAFLGRNGATNNGKTITPQAVRTLLASIPQYFGFVFINTNTTPNSLFVTMAGKKLLEEQTNFLNSYKFKTLSDATKNNGEINYSDVYLKQFAKLQITNPVIMKDCENILVFPLLFLIKVLFNVQYLTFDEIAYFIFKSKNEDEVDLISLEINNFRTLTTSKRIQLIEAYKRTHLGNISLVQAPTVAYFFRLCNYTGLFLKEKQKLIKDNGEEYYINTMRLDFSKSDIINEIISNYNFRPYDFKDNLDLWMQYIGNYDVNYTPKNITVINRTNYPQLIIIKENNLTINGDLVQKNDLIVFPALENNKYEILVYDLTSGQIIESKECSYSDEETIEIRTEKIDKVKAINLDTIIIEISEHVASKYFSVEYSQYLRIVSSLIDKDLIKSKNLRGSRLEHLFFRYFKEFEERSIIEEVLWNGRVGKFGIPTPAPGGVSGLPDLLLFIENNIVVIEVTTIKSKSLQWSSEGASVPDHIRLIKQNYPNYNIFALYLAPIIHHERVTKGMLSRLNEDNVKLICVEIETFFEISKNFNKKKFIEYLNSNKL